MFSFPEKNITKRSTLVFPDFTVGALLGAARKSTPFSISSNSGHILLRFDRLSRIKEAMVWNVGSY